MHSALPSPQTPGRAEESRLSTDTAESTATAGNEAAGTDDAEVAAASAAGGMGRRASENVLAGPEDGPSGEHVEERP